MATEKFLTVARDAAHEGGRVLMEWLGRIEAKEKAPRDLVTEADVASQKAIESLVLEAFPDHQFLGEEETGGPTPDLAPGARPCWIVDPLDGTTNFVHQLPNFSVSVALAVEGSVVVGVVYDPVLKECYWAVAGEGAWLNGRRLAVSPCRVLSKALVAVSLSADVARDSTEVERFLRVVGQCQAMRRLGSAALNLCYLAAGRLDAYWATSVKTWDVAAGQLLMREAGGEITGIRGEPFDLFDPHFLATSTPELHRVLLGRLQ